MSEFEILRLVEVFSDAARLLLWCSLQAILLLGLTWILARLFRRYSAAIRHNLWLAGLLAVAAAPLLAIVLRAFPASNPAVGNFVRFGEMPAFFRLLADGNTTESFTIANIGWFDWTAATVFAVWLVGVFVCSVRVAVAYRQMKRIRRNAQTLDADKDFYESLQIPAALKLPRSAEISNPALVGVLRPVILLPAEIEKWSQSETRAIVRHESAHYERGDHLVRPLQTLLASIFFFHPLVRYALNQLSFERESACDERVLESGVAPENYKEVILKVAEQDVLQRESYSLAFNPAKKFLTRRINRIMSNKNQSLSSTSRYLLMASVVSFFAFVVWFASPNFAVKAEHQSSIFGETTSKEDEETFRKIYEEMKQIILKGDKAAFEKFFAEDYTAISPTGTTMTKEQVVDRHVQKPNADVKLETVNFSEFKVRVSGDSAIVTYSAEMSGSHKGNKFAHRARITDIWEKKDGKWLSVASHASHVQ